MQYGTGFKYVPYHILFGMENADTLDDAYNRVEQWERDHPDPGLYFMVVIQREGTGPWEETD